LTRLIDHLDQAVRAKAFRGELVRHDLNDQPASVLLERIRAEHAAMAVRARAKAEGTRLGRPATVADDAAKVRAMRADRAAGKSIRAIAREHGVGIGTVARITS